MSSNQIQRKTANILLLVLVLVACSASAANEQPLRPWLKSRAALRGQQQQQPNRAPSSANSTQNHQVASNQPQSQATNQPLSSASSSASGANRTTRTADIFQNGDGYNIFVTNTCERESMKVNIKTSRAFNGVIHTRSEREKPICTVEGNGETEFNLEISHVLNQQDPNYCGVIKAKRESPGEKDILSVVVAVRLHKNVELSDDKFFLLNCTNRCRKADCSSAGSSAKLFSAANEPADDANGARATPKSNTNGRLSAPEDGVGEREGTNLNSGANETTTSTSPDDECTIWKFPWLITLLWCLGILLLAMIISHCIMCSSMVCRCVRTEVEEKEPSVYEGATDLDEDDDDRLYSNKRHPCQIEYDNADIYKTSNNYAPYTLEDAKSKRKHKRKNSR